MYIPQPTIVGLEITPHCRAPKMAAATMLTTTPRLALPYKSRSCAARSCGLLESRLTRATDAVGRMAHNPITGVIAHPNINVVSLDLKPARTGLVYTVHQSKPATRLESGMKEIFVSVSGPIEDPCK